MKVAPLLCATVCVALSLGGCDMNQSYEPSELDIAQAKCEGEDTSYAFERCMWDEGFKQVWEAR